MKEAIAVLKFIVNKGNIFWRRKETSRFVCACVRACVRACIRAYMYLYAYTHTFYKT